MHVRTGGNRDVIEHAVNERADVVLREAERHAHSGIAATDVQKVANQSVHMAEIVRRASRELVSL